jgi:aminocarboxymuconate-semialdehyde decarboxylase
VLVDAHAHVLPRDYPAGAPPCFPQMELIEDSADRMLVFGPMRFRAREVFFEAERRMEAQDASGVDAEVLSPMPPLLRYDLPAAVICSDAFAVTAGAMAAMQGAPDYQYLITPHPVAVLTPEHVRERAKQLLPKVVAMLTERADQ